jgi:hypothetical protein
MAMVFVSPGIEPPTISTMPNSPSVCAKVSTAAVISPGQASGSSTVRSALERRHAATGGGLAHLRRDRLEAALGGLDGEGQVEDYRGEEEALEGEDELVAEDLLPEPAHGRVRAKGDEQVEAEHGRRQDERQRHQRLGHPLAPEPPVGEQPPEPDRHGREQDDGPEGELERQAQRRPVHAVSRRRAGRAGRSRSAP